MKFLAITLIVHAPDPVTGVRKTTGERFREVIDNALLAEELGFDGFGVGERHERPFISSSPPVVLSHIAALTSRIRLFTAVTTLSLLDPLRAYEDYATLDHLSGGRLGPSSIHACARAVPSLRATLSRTRRRWVLRERSIRPTMPQSMRYAGDPGWTKMLPGWGPRGTTHQGNSPCT